MNINWKSIESKARAYLNTPEAQKKIQKKIDGYMLGRLAIEFDHPAPPNIISLAEAFISILRTEVDVRAGSDYGAGFLGSTAVDVLSKVSYGEPTASEGYRYSIPISYDGNLHRESLDPQRFSAGIDNIAALLNTGYDARAYVRGVWKGHGDSPVYSLRSRDGAHFLQNTKQIFMDKYRKKYGVVNIQFDDIYDIDE